MRTGIMRCPVPLLIALAAFTAGCESTAPEVDALLDTDAALADYDAVGSLLASPDWEAFRALGGRTPYSAAVGVGAVSALDALGEGGSRAFALALSRSLASSTAGFERPSAAPIISDTHRGATFVYDAESDQYVVDPERTGAPATGVRFVLYEVDFLGVPMSDEEIGYADLVDEGDSSAEDVALRLTVVSHDHNVLEYLTTVDIGVLWAEVTVSGFLRDDDDLQLDFDISVEGEQSVAGGAMNVAFDLEVESRDFSIAGSVSGIENGGEGEGDVELTVTHGNRTLDVDVTGTSGVIDGTIYLDGELFATLTGPEDNPTIVSGDGDPLTSDEIVVLLRVLDVAEDIFDFLEDLVEPVGAIVLVGIIL